MASDQERAKKAHEQYLAEYFARARAIAIGKTLQILQADECPDFICTDENESLVGLEVAQVTRGPIDSFWARILEGEIELDPFDASAMIYSLITKKEVARRERYSKKVPQCILMLALVNSTLERLSIALDGIEDDFSEHGFSEVWLVDYSGMDAYRNAEVFGIFPAEIWGHYERPNARTKPYG